MDDTAASSLGKSLCGKGLRDTRTAEAPNGVFLRGGVGFSLRVFWEFGGLLYVVGPLPKMCRKILGQWARQKDNQGV